jgi:hypothetical protein
MSFCTLQFVANVEYIRISVHRILKLLWYDLYNNIQIQANSTIETIHVIGIDGREISRFTFLMAKRANY